MYFDFHRSEVWEYPDRISVQVIYKLYTDPGYLSVHKIIDAEKYIFVYTMEGKGKFYVDGKEINVVANQLLVVNAKESLSYSCSGKCWNFWLFEYKNSTNSLTPNVVYDFFMKKEELMMSSMALEALKEENRVLASTLFASLYYIALDKIKRGVMDKKYKVITSATNYIRENLSTFSVDDLSTYLNINERTLLNIFNDYLGTSPKKLHKYMRLEASKEYLETTRMSIEEIAKTLGYANSGHFSAVFKSEYSITPARYRMIFNAGVSSQI